MPLATTGNRDLIRAINTTLVLNTVRTLGPISRTEIAQRTGLSAATITGISAELIDKDLIFEKSTGDSSGGRRPILMDLNPRGGYVVGLKLTEDHITAALTDLRAVVVDKQTTPLSGSSVDEGIAALCAAVTNLVAANRIPEQRLLGVGVGLAGVVEADKGVLRHSPIIGWNDVPLASRMQQCLNVPVYVDNDVNTFTLTEKWFGVGQKVDNFLVVTVGRGVGMGIVVNGQLYRGCRGGAGELGHTVVDANGRLCGCGKRGCLETVASDPAMLLEARLAFEQGQLEGRPKSISELVAMAAEGSLAARNILASAGETLGRSLANLINLFNPTMIVVSGEGVAAGEIFFAAMREQIGLHCMNGLAADTEIKIDAWEDDAWARGAAGLVLHGIFESPIYREQVD